MIRHEVKNWDATTGKLVAETRTDGVGTTVYTTTESERIMSDVWEYVTRAYYWTGEGLSSVNITRWDNSEPTAEVTHDADYDTVIREFHARALEHAIQDRRIAHEREAEYTAVKGREVVVIKGRDHVGVRGRVAVVKEMTYRAGYRTQILPKLAVALDDEMTTWTAPNGRQYPVHKNVVWVWAHNCRVANHVVDEAQVLAEARVIADRKTAEFRGTCIRYGALAA